jgi:hypothetical protein
MPGLKITLDGEKYEVDLDKVTLGEGRFLKSQFGMRSYSELDLLDPDPDMIVGAIAVAMKRSHPELDDSEVIEKVESLPNGDYFKQIQKQIEVEVEKARKAAEDPQPADATVSAPAAKRQSGAKTRKTRTSPSSVPTA